MKLKRTNRCKECPFRKNAPAGWLGPWTVDSIFSQVHSEQGLACHVDVGTKKHLSDDELVKQAHVCVGSLQHTHKTCKRYRDPELQAMRDKVGPDNDNVLGFEFKAYHSKVGEKK